MGFQTSTRGPNPTSGWSCLPVEKEVVGHDADDGKRPIVQEDCRADQIGSAAKPRRPKRMTDEDDPIVAWLVLLGEKRPPTSGADAKQRKEIGGNACTVEPLGFPDRSN
jgi:hypothetical protein